jgi:CheY-like chemotaxis protein
MGDTANASGILVVDDDLDTAQMFAMLLQELGHAVEYVTRPQPVLEIARRMKPWLIFHKRSREAGFDAHVHKPVDIHLLQSILAELR